MFILEKVKPEDREEILSSHQKLGNREIGGKLWRLKSFGKKKNLSLLVT